MKVDAYKLENGDYYNEVGRIEYQGITYLLLANSNNVKDICFRKLIKKDDLEYIAQLDSAEFSLIMDKFSAKYEKIFN